eukprot:1156181-Pelagomonas_calceolata.AAC.1
MHGHIEMNVLQYIVHKMIGVFILSNNLEAFEHNLPCLGVSAQLFYPSICTRIRPNTKCAVWPGFAFAFTLSKLSKLLVMTTCLLYVTFVMPKMMCSVGAVKKGQGANTEQNSRAQARKPREEAQAIKATWGPPRRYENSGGYAGPPSYGNGPPASKCAYGGGNTCLLPSDGQESECQTWLTIPVNMGALHGHTWNEWLRVTCCSTLFIKCLELSI